MTQQLDCNALVKFLNDIGLGFGSSLTCQYEDCHFKFAPKAHAVYCIETLRFVETFLRQTATVKHVSVSALPRHCRKAARRASWPLRYEQYDLRMQLYDQPATAQWYKTSTGWAIPDMLLTTWCDANVMTMTTKTIVGGGRHFDDDECYDTSDAPLVGRIAKTLEACKKTSPPYNAVHIHALKRLLLQRSSRVENALFAKERRSWQWADRVGLWTARWLTHAGDMRKFQPTKNYVQSLLAACIDDD